MQLDIEKYRHHLASYDLGDEERDEFIRQVWKIAQNCVDRAWGHAPEQILLGITGTKCPARAHDQLDSFDPLSPTFNSAANEDAAGKLDP